uniref:Secreted protein n=1 Tax=Glossina palpalis gambiensis TaxID=67801 RepID=A0A1B0B303_9MUSC
MKTQKNFMLMAFLHSTSSNICCISSNAVKVYAYRSLLNMMRSKRVLSGNAIHPTLDATPRQAGNSSKSIYNLNPDLILYVDLWSSCTSVVACVFNENKVSRFVFV